MLKLERIPMETLLFLVERRGEIVTRDQIVERIWGKDVFLDTDNSINGAIRKIRQVLRDDSEQPHFIQTITGQGYRFIAAVVNDEQNKISEDNGIPRAAISVSPPASGKDGEDVPSAAEAQSENLAGGTDSERRVRFNRIAVAATAAVAILASIIVVIVLQRRNSKPAMLPSVPSAQVRSLAVLPLKDLSGDPEQAYFAEGMTDELITRLAAIENLRVISHTSVTRYADTRKSLPEIASELHVDALIEGTILHAGEHVRINAQLIRGVDDRHLWAASYERDVRNVLDLQDEIARDVAWNISLQLSPIGESRLTARRAVQPEALQHYLRGRYGWATRHPEELPKAILEFQKAIEADPQFAPAYAGLADCYVVLPLVATGPTAELYAKAKEAADKALTLDPTLAEVHTSVAYAKLYQDWDFAGAEREFQQALRLDDNYSTAHQWYAELLALEGRREEAITQIQKAEELDPFSAVIHHQAGQVFRQARQYPRAIAEYKNSLALNPQMYVNYWWLAETYLHEGKPHEWAEAWKLAQGGGPEVASRAADYELAYSRDGIKGWSRKRISEFQRLSQRQLYFAALRYASLGNNARAFEYLNQAYAAREPEVLTIGVDPEWDSLRGDPRFLAFIKKIGLTEVRRAEISSRQSIGNPTRTDN